MLKTQTVKKIIIIKLAQLFYFYFFRVYDEVVCTKACLYYSATFSKVLFLHRKSILLGHSISTVELN